MPPDQNDKELAFDKLLNFRDVAQTINSFSGNTTLQTRALYRSARPDSATQRDRDLLANRYGMKTVIDLRTTTEHLEASKKYSSGSESDEVGTKNTKTDVPQVPGAKHVEINLNGKGFERHLVWQLSYWNLAKLAGLMAFGYRVEGISVLGKNVLQRKGLTGLAQDTLDYSGPEIKQVFDILADESSYPVLVHCTQGKDRTGLIVLLVLLLCGVDVDAIAHDYVKSEQELAPEFEERMKEISSIGLDETFAKCAPDFASSTVKYLEVKYGGVEQYLAGLRVSSEQVGKIQSVLLV